MKLKEHEAISFEFPNSIDLIPPVNKQEKYLRYFMILLLVFIVWRKRPELFYSLYQILTFTKGK